MATGRAVAPLAYHALHDGRVSGDVPGLGALACAGATQRACVLLHVPEATAAGAGDLHPFPSYGCHRRFPALAERGIGLYDGVTVLKNIYIRSVPRLDS